MTVNPRFGIAELKHIFLHATDSDIKTALEELGRDGIVCSMMMINEKIERKK